MPDFTPGSSTTVFTVNQRSAMSRNAAVIDGTEEQILSGGVRTLGDPRLKTLLVEVEDKRGQRERIDELAAQAGLTCSGCFAPALAPPDERIVNCVYVRKTVGSHAAEAAT